MEDAAILRRAAIVLVKHSRKPRSFGMTVLLRILRDTADKIEQEALNVRQEA